MDSVRIGMRDHKAAQHEEKIDEQKAAANERYRV